MFKQIMEKSEYFLSVNWEVSVVVSIPPFQGGDMGSNPVSLRDS